MSLQYNWPPPFLISDYRLAYRRRADGAERVDYVLQVDNLIDVGGWIEI